MSGDKNDSGSSWSAGKGGGDDGGSPWSKPLQHDDGGNAWNKPVQKDNDGAWTKPVQNDDGGKSWDDSGGEKSGGYAGLAAAEAAQEGSFTETTTKSWGSRIGGAFTGILVGLIMIPAACWLLFWNEGRAVHTARALTEGAGSVVSVAADRPDAAREGRLVHVSGPLVVNGSLSDSDTGVSAQGVAVLRRRVEMYQWRESSSSSTSTNLGGSQTTQTTYSYTRVWSESAINSGQFRQPGGHANPAMPLSSRSVTAAEGNLGGFRLAEPQLRQLSANEALPLANPIRTIAGRRSESNGQTIYVGNDPNNPVIGDMRISYEVAKPATVSVIARQVGRGFAPYATSNGETLHLVSAGSKTAQEMIQQAEADNAMWSWILRAVGTLLVFIGFSMIFAPIRVLADVVPIFGSIVGFGTGLIAGILTLVIAPLVIAIAWLAYRPITAMIVIAVGAALAFGLSALRGRFRRPVAAAAR